MGPEKGKAKAKIRASLLDSRAKTQLPSSTTRTLGLVFAAALLWPRLPPLLHH